MNAFSDVLVTFGSPSAPGSQRLGNRWHHEVDGPGSIWRAAAVPAGPVAHDRVEHQGWRLWAVGDVFAYRSDTSGPLPRFARDLADGRADPAALDAHAVVFGWEEGPRRLHVWTDRLATVHAYVGGPPGRRAVGTYLAAVAEGSARTLDWEAITGFCGFGFYPADRTMFDDVRILRPATWTTFDDRGTVLSASRYWDWTYTPDGHRSDDELVDEFHDVWQRTIATQFGTRQVVVPVSGGLDSRTVLAAAVPADGSATPWRARAFTYGYTSGSAEIRISRRVARARGVEATPFVVEPYLFDRLGEVEEAVEGFQSVSVARQAGISGPLAAMGDRVVGGHWGDVWFDSAGGSSSDGSLDSLVEIAHGKFAKRGRQWLLEHLCAPHLVTTPDHVLRSFLRDELGRLPDLEDPDAMLRALKTDQWSFRWTLASVRAYQLGLPTLLPFYANDVVDFFQRVPSDRLGGRRLQVAYLRRHHRDLAKVTWQESGMSLFEAPWEPAAVLGRRAVHKAVRTIGRVP
ncbi:MAG TPA: asparagine synthase-related protein, partial [Acidimicrobiales bacterium]